MSKLCFCYGTNDWQIKRIVYYKFANVVIVMQTSNVDCFLKKNTQNIVCESYLLSVLNKCTCVFLYKTSTRKAD